MQAVLQEGLIASHRATAAAGLPRLQNVQTLCLFSLASPLWSPGMRGQLYSEEGSRHAQLLLPGQVTWSGRVELSSLAYLWHFALAVHTKAGESQFCVFSSVAKNLEAEARGH